VSVVVLVDTDEEVQVSGQNHRGLSWYVDNFVKLHNLLKTEVTARSASALPRPGLGTIG